MVATYLKACSIFFITFALVSPGQAQEGAGAGDSQDSFDLSIQQKAESGDREAQNEMGRISQENRDYSGALKWYKLSADQGLSGAQVNLGFLYNKGLGTKVDMVQAAYWYGQAAAQNNGTGEFDLALCYLRGEGVRLDRDEAINLFTRALSDGDGGHAANEIGMIYETRPHEDQNKDYVVAYRWYQRAAEMGFAAAGYNVCRLAAQGLGVAADYREAKKWCSQLAESGDERSVWGQYGMGRLYEDGLGVTQDSEAALAWYRKAADRGHTVSQIRLAALYAAGKGVEINLIQAYMWIEIAAFLNDPSAPGYLQELKAQMREHEISEAHALAANWIKDHPPDPAHSEH